MVWQDIIFALGSTIFAVALIPSVIQVKPPALATSVPTAIVLLIFTITYITMGYYFAAFTTLCSALLWGILAVQKTFNAQL